MFGWVGTAADFITRSIIALSGVCITSLVISGLGKHNNRCITTPIINVLGGLAGCFTRSVISFLGEHYNGCITRSVISLLGEHCGGYITRSVISLLGEQCSGCITRSANENFVLPKLIPSERRHRTTGYIVVPSTSLA